MHSMVFDCKNSSGNVLTITTGTYLISINPFCPAVGFLQRVSSILPVFLS